MFEDFLDAIKGEYMCLVCIDFKKNLLTVNEARRNLSEIVLGKELQEDEQEHVVEVLSMLDEVDGRQN